MKRKLLNTIQFLLFLGLGLFLLHLTFKNQDVGAQFEEVTNADYKWALPVLFFSLLCYCVRVLRWKMLAKPLGFNPPFHHALMALSVGYFVNLGIPRLGELTRCAILRRTDKIPFNYLFGTVLMERLIDAITLFLIVVLTVVFRFDLLKDFFIVNIATPLYESIFYRLLSAKMLTGIFIIAGLLLIIAIVYFFNRYRTHRYVAVVRRVGGEFWAGMKSIVIMKDKWLFLTYTAIIWICYVMMTYFWFFCFGASSRLGLYEAFTIMAIGSIGRSVPIQGGGMGAYHFLVANLIMLFGISEHYGRSLAIIIHGGQTIFTLITGILSLIGLFIIWKKPEI